GSLGIDVAAAVTTILKDTKVHKIPTGITGPLVEIKSGIGGLLIDRSSSVLAGLIVLPGVIDADYSGVITVYAYTLLPLLTITVGTPIAQLILYSEVGAGDEIHCRPYRGARGFGSTGNTIISLVQKMKQRPVVQVTLQTQTRSIPVIVMLDTGADVTIIN
ncbi:POK9 protein, partial [Dasyornis broadbenti]|nr:POK9 protein [Dasyornis broadbenti]